MLGFINNKRRTFRIFPWRGWSASLLLELSLLLVPDLPAAHLFLSHAAEELLLLVVVQLVQQLGVHPQVLQDLLQHFDSLRATHSLSMACLQQSGNSV